MTAMPLASTVAELPKPEASDADLLSSVQRGMLPRAEQDACRHYQAARSIPGAPVWSIDREWAAFQRRYGAAPDPARTNHNSAEWQAASIVRLRIALEAGVAFRLYAKMDRRELQERFMRDKDDAARVVSTGQQPQAAPQVFDAKALIVDLARRGITLTLGTDGSILANAAALLTDGDRAQLKAHAPAIATLLAPQEVA